MYILYSIHVVYKFCISSSYSYFLRITDNKLQKDLFDPKSVSSVSFCTTQSYKTWKMTKLLLVCLLIQVICSKGSFLNKTDETQQGIWTLISYAQTCFHSSLNCCGRTRIWNRTTAIYWGSVPPIFWKVLFHLGSTRPQNFPHHGW